jgi:hypothetical protein
MMSEKTAVRLAETAYDMYSHTDNIEVADRETMEVSEREGSVLTIGCEFDYRYAVSLRDEYDDGLFKEIGFFEIRIDLETSAIVSARSGITKGKNPGGALREKDYPRAYGAAGVEFPASGAIPRG